MKKNKKINFTLMLSLLCIVPTLVCATILTLVSINKISSGLEDGVYAKLNASTEEMCKYFEYDIKSKGTVEYDINYIDSLKEQDIELTLFEKNIRFCTSITNEKGERNEGTSADSDIYARVQKGEVVQLKNVVIGGQPYYVVYRPMYDKDNQFWGMAFAGSPQSEVNSVIGSARNYMISILGLLIIVFIALGIFLSLKLRKSMVYSVKALKNMSDGDITTDFNIQSPIEELQDIGNASMNLKKQLQTSVNLIKKSTLLLTETIDNVDNTTKSNAESVAQINMAINEVAETSQSVAQSAQILSEKAFELGQNIEELSENVTILSDETTNIKSANSEANEYMSIVLDSSKKSVVAVEQIAKEIADTNDAVKDINKCISMINEIASETKLLSLNASIEAARAGEAGRGFSVVASNIKQLAESSAENVEKITDIINHITDLSAKSVRGAEKVQDIIEEEQKYIKDTQAKFDVLKNNVESSIEEINSIANKTKSLNSIKQDVTSACSDLGAISEELGASAEEVSASSSNVSEALNKTIEKTNNMKLINSDLVTATKFFK